MPKQVLWSHYTLYVKNTNFGPTQRACYSALGIPKPSDYISDYRKTPFPLFPQPLGLWLGSAARCKSAVLFVQSFRVLRTDHHPVILSDLILSETRETTNILNTLDTPNTLNTAFLLFFLLSRCSSLPRG